MNNATALKTITDNTSIGPGDAYITTSKGMAGYFAVQYWHNPEGFFEPYDTGFGRYATEQEAMLEARSWAKEEGLPLMV